MRQENKPYQTANNKDCRYGNDYLLQYVHILLLIS